MCLLLLASLRVKVIQLEQEAIMSKYNVTYVKYYSYTVEADCEDEAESLAHEEYLSDMRCPVADTWYDDIEIECLE